MKVKFWGTRGSLPSPGPQNLRHGGDTSCVEVLCGSTRLVFDMGSGAARLGNALLAELPVSAHVFFSHVHHDHTMGFPFFVPHYIPGNQFTYYGMKKQGSHLKNQFETLFSYPFFPVALDDMSADMAFRDLAEGDAVRINEHLVVRNKKLNHPDGCFGFRVEFEEDSVQKVFTYCTDTEHFSVVDWKVRELARDADIFVYDCMYTDEEYPQKIGWGHSTSTAAIETALEAGVKKLVLFHHDPVHSDDKLDEMEAAAVKIFSGTVSAKDGLELEI